jgi:hypothetical protein
MRFFRANQTPRSPEDEAAAVRLMAIANRGKVASLPDHGEVSPETPAEPQSPESLQ